MASRGGGTPAASGASGPAELQLPQGPGGLSPPPPPPPRNYADHNAPRRRRNYPPHTAPRPLPARAHVSREAAGRARPAAVTGSNMADGRPRIRAALRRSGRHNARAAAQTGLSVENKSKSVRSTLAKQRLAVFPDLRNGTPRVMLKRVIQSQPQVSPLALRISNHEDTQEAHSEVPSKRVSSMGELQLPDVAPEDRITVFRMTKKRKKLSISEFERAAERRLPQYQAQSTLDSTIMTRSLHMSVGSLLAPDTVEKRGLLRRPKIRRAVDMQEFEGRVEQNMLKNKGQNYLVDSPSASGIRTSLLTSDAEMMMNSTELFVQPQLDEQSQNKSALEPQLSSLKTSAERSLISDADQEEARLEGLVSGMSTKEKRYSKSSSLDHEHVDRTTDISPQTPAKEQEEKQDHSHQSNRVAQISFTEEEVVCTAEHGANAGYSEHLEKKLSEKAELQITAAQDNRGETEVAPSAGKELAEGSVETHSSPRAEREITVGIGAESLGRHSHAFSSFYKPEMTPLNETDEQEGEPQDQAIMLELNNSVEEPAEDEAEHPASQEVSMKTPAFVRAPASNLLLSTPRVAKPAAPRSPLQQLQPKVVSKRLRTSEKKPRDPQIPRSLIKEAFRHFAKMPVTRDAYRIVEKCSERYFKQLSDDLEAYTHHAGRRTVEAADLEVLMRRQGLVTDKTSLNVLIERHFPLQYRKLLIPVAVSGNKVISSN
ncbi:centromere protein T isoform X1 [Oenanthe melanoleuca]|uniref:centromere protein T isoform X1 n=1 Tax=Oenanthe melanoleuca TaxID=2939378 RepID=UPI0024C1ABE3|nr:centromere protein T isoform X1 [Oenanthe melanoleuca]